MFGRVRPLPGAPILPRLHALDAKEFFKVRRQVDEQLASDLMSLHQTQMDRFNAMCRRKSNFKPGDLVWFLRPRTICGSKLSSWWLGPCPVLRRLGNNSYEIEVKPDSFITVHRGQLKAFVHDPSVASPALHQYTLTGEESSELEDGGEAVAPMPGPAPGVAPVRAATSLETQEDEVLPHPGLLPQLPSTTTDSGGLGSWTQRLLGRLK